MVKLTSVLLLIIHWNIATALEGRVTVLDSPVFAEKNEKSKILFYYRKGESIFLHGGSKPDSEERFYKTVIPTTGQEAFILKEHVMINFGDKREIGQKLIQHDHTDYRLPEPLPKDYPLKIEQTGYRGHFQIALGQPNMQTYPYNQDILDSSFDLLKAFNFIYTERAKVDDLEDRLYFGAIAGFQVSTVEYVLTSQVAKQEQTLFYIGPHLNYEAYKAENVGIDLYINIHLNLYNNLRVEIKDNATDEKETRDYAQSFSVSPNIGSAVNFKNSVFGFDTLLGFNLKTLLPGSYSTRENGEFPNLWKNGSEKESFNQTTRVELSYFLGFRAVY